MGPGACWDKNMAQPALRKRAMSATPAPPIAVRVQQARETKGKRNGPLGINLMRKSLIPLRKAS